MNSEKELVIDALAESGNACSPPPDWQERVWRQLEAETPPVLASRKPWWVVAGISGGIGAALSFAIAFFLLRAGDSPVQYQPSAESRAEVEQVRKFLIEEAQELAEMKQEVNAAIAAAQALSEEARTQAMQTKLAEAALELVRLKRRVAAQVQFKARRAMSAKKAKKRADKKKFNKCVNASDPLCGL